MEDRVGEVLAQRAALDRGPGSAVALSLFLHGAAVAIAIWLASHLPVPQTVSVVNIRFAPMPAAVPKNATVRSSSRKHTVTEAPVPPVPKKISHFEQPVTKPVPAPTVAPPKDAVPLSSFGRSSKKGTETPVPPPAAPPHPTAVVTPTTTTAAPTIDVPVGSAGVTGLEGGDFPYTIYIERMKTLVGSRWLRPQVTPGTAAIVYFVINRDGTIRDAKVETASNSSTFDRAALRAILESTPLPPLPFGYSGTYLGVHLTFK